MCWHYNIAMIPVSNLRTQDGIADNVLQVSLPYQKSCRISDRWYFYLGYQTLLIIGSNFLTIDPIDSDLSLPLIPFLHDQ